MWTSPAAVLAAVPRWLEAALFLVCATLAAPRASARPLPAGRDDAPRPVREVSRDVDAMLAKAWEESFLEAGPELDDGLYLRRLSIDLRGVIPDADEVLRFASDDDPEKFSKWASWFLHSPDFADFFAERWEQIFLGREGGTDGLDRAAFRRWLREAFLVGKPWNELARELLTSRGAPDDQPAVNFFLRFAGTSSDETAKDVAARVARVFLGTRIECAQCHDHPYMDLQREQFWGLAAFFARAELRRVVDRAGGQSDRRALVDRDEGEIRMPPMKQGEEARVIPPLFLGERYRPAETGESTSPRPAPPSRPRRSSTRAAAKSAEATRREELAKWITSEENPFFARALVNRLWAHFFGKGFFNPIDDFTLESNVVFPELLDFLAGDFKKSGWDVRRLVHVIVSTHAYRQRALRGVPGGLARGETHDLFASIPIRPLEAEVLGRSVLRATGLEEPQPERNAERVRRYIERATKEFERRFGVDESEKRDEFQGTVLQVLLLFNGDFTEGEAPADRTFRAAYENIPEGSLGVVLEGVPPAAHLDRLFLAALSRRPTGEERLAFERHLAAARTHEARERALRDIQWALLNSAEFLHQH